MKISTKRHITTAILSVIIALSLIQFAAASSKLTAKENAVSFLADVVGLDMAKYNTTVVVYNSYPADTNGVVAAHANYRLESAEGKVEVSCQFRNNALVSLGMNRLGDSSILYAQPQPTDLLSRAKGLIQRYQDYSGAAYLQTMNDLLSTVTELKPMNATSGNVKLIIKINEPFTHIDWIYTVNGTDVPRKVIGFKFEDGSFANFGNGWDLYTVGSTDMKLSRDDAIRIARQHAQSYSWKVGNTTVSKFTILDSPVNAENSMQPRGDNMLYPWWNIQLYLDKTYPGMIGSIQVGLWADTGEITNIEAISTGGPPPEDSTDPTESSTEQSLTSENGTVSSMNMYIITATAIIALVGAALLIHFRKIRKTTKKPEKIMPEEGI